MAISWLVTTRTTFHHLTRCLIHGFLVFTRGLALEATAAGLPVKFDWYSLLNSPSWTHQPHPADQQQQVISLAQAGSIATFIYAGVLEPFLAEERTATLSPGCHDLPPRRSVHQLLSLSPPGAVIAQPLASAHQPHPAATEQHATVKSCSMMLGHRII